MGAAKLQSDLTLNWGGIEGFRIAGKQGIGIIAACQAVRAQRARPSMYPSIHTYNPALSIHVPIHGFTIHPFTHLSIHTAESGHFVAQLVHGVKV